ncbi:bifunctional 23S rRNA (guanine(2069)-N(7))-methyltransferase RlmK/23S rRNA (guanine(2445)-N(2))-methyltransferase RlmL [Thiomicrospira sp. WB1]|uniref:bifunctional 23S rRNA (guanine(2069)-N(7))-methyltransferase RlmK/23S rRNA (guanine(2445)-N(2))-methyltransferase RlmL n=1 Tax=Thiomicrospira sp. WB1 TaxID=1685380 RepID=UPI0007483278|nr:bifunctional 23S rRNA (guanine(2069)-N(7))-methyltransferase RlmK/23S rRNA (guanine(2445)-N(2))-methyltransferase RlmL [Thiomicrospira sp. WB1]KUJ71338.1 50S rRNA methyltransferase [Thiomicrospira sp. WB1]
MCRFFATSPPGLSEILREELESLGAVQAKAQPLGVAFEGDLEVGYRACLWSRVANRVFLELAEMELANQEDLTRQVTQLPWWEHLDVDGTFAVSFTGKGLGIEHSHFGALTVKDGVVDAFQARYGRRPSVDMQSPDVRIHAHLNRQTLRINLDLAGHSLHQRGYRLDAKVTAPLKENVAAALLYRAQWPSIAAKGGDCYDPMCGSGTFLIEAAMMAADVAPGLASAERMQLTRWRGHDDALWQRLLSEAGQREADGLRKLGAFYGSDVSHKSIQAAERAIAAAGFDDVIELKPMAVEQAHRWGPWQPGLVISNPPYGERLGEIEAVRPLYTKLGDLLKAEFEGWQAAILTCHDELAKAVGLKAKRWHSVNNGAMECRLYRFDVTEENFRQAALPTTPDLAAQLQTFRPELAESEGARMFANRLRKNLKQLKSWRKQNQIEAFRAYDADMPEYALAIDVYDTNEDGRWCVVAEYAPPKTVNAGKARRRLHEALVTLPEVLQMPAENIVFKVRDRQKGQNQYEKLDEQKRFLTVNENQTRLRVNFTDYLDTGLFLDHRDVRAWLAQQCAGKRLLNLFCYTASASATAAVAGAKSSLSLDLSKTYLNWAQKNFRFNQIDEDAHQLQRADVLQWLQTMSKDPGERPPLFDWVFLDPPSFSTSKRMDDTLDVQRDHVRLIEQAMALLKPGGQLLFSTNLRQFKLDKAAFEGEWQITDLTRKTLPKDFERNPKIHQAWWFSPQAR